MDKKVDRFEELEVWQASTELAIALYEQLRDCKDFGMKDQMQRAAVSIASNIAEGFDRQTQKEFIQFLFIARGSCAEVRTQLHIAAKVSILPSAEAEVLQEQTRKISAMLYNLIQYRKKFICLTLHPGRVGVHRVPLTLLPFTLYPTKNV